MTLRPRLTVTPNSGEAALIAATISIPAGALSDTAVTTVIAAVSGATLAVTARVTGTALIGQVAGVALIPDRTGIASSGSVIAYQHTLINTGNSADVFDLAHNSSQRWTVQVNTPISLNAGQAATIMISLTVPTGVISATLDKTIITATSRMDTSQFVSVTDTTTIISNQNLYLPIILRN